MIIVFIYWEYTLYTLQYTLYIAVDNCHLYCTMYIMQYIVQCVYWQHALYVFLIQLKLHMYFNILKVFNTFKTKKNYLERLLIIFFYEYLYIYLYMCVYVYVCVCVCVCVCFIRLFFTLGYVVYSACLARPTTAEMECCIDACREGIRLAIVWGGRRQIRRWWGGGSLGVTDDRLRGESLIPSVAQV